VAQAVGHSIWKERGDSDTIPTWQEWESTGGRKALASEKDQRKVKRSGTRVEFMGPRICTREFETSVKVKPYIGSKKRSKARVREVDEGKRKERGGKEKEVCAWKRHPPREKSPKEEDSNGEKLGGDRGIGS